MPANTSKVQRVLDRELEKKVADAPLEFRSVETLFSDDGIFQGTAAFFNADNSSSNESSLFESDTEPRESTVSDAVATLLHNEKKNQQLINQISHEEIADIIQKLTVLVAMPPGQLDSESELYLEQQLSDVLGFQVSSEIDGHRLLYNTGKVKALPHIKLHPNDSLSSHAHRYAQLSNRRGSFGWFLEQGKISEESEKLEKFYCALPLYFFPEWKRDHKRTRKWYKHRKVIFINPIDTIAVVCSLAVIAPNTPSRYQFGASPEAIISGKLWSPGANGRVLVLLVEDPDNRVSHGPRRIFKEV